MERYYYFDGIARPGSLSPLLEYARPWRANNKVKELSVIYDSYIDLYENRSVFRKFIDHSLSWFRIGGDYYRYYRGRISGARFTKNKGRTRIGFFVISDRFVNFFQDYDSRLDTEQKVYYSPLLFNSFTNRVVNSPSFAPDKAFKNSFSDLPVGLNHALFPVCFRICFYFMRIKGALANSSPDVLVFAEGTSHYDELASLAASELKIPTVRLQSGRAALLHSGYRNMRFDVMLNWGEGFNQRYAKVSPSAEQIACGCPLLDDITVTTGERTNNVIIFTQPVAKGVLLEQDYLMLEQLAKRLLHCDQDIKVLVRMHPADTRTGFLDIANKSNGRIQIVNAPEYTLSEVMSRGECAVSFASTTLSEAAASGVIPILIKLEYQKKLFPFPEDVGAVVVADSMDSAVKVIRKVLWKSQDWSRVRASMQEFGNHFFGPRDRKAMDRVTDHLREIAKGKKIDP